MKVTRKLDKPIDVIEDIFCNKCGLSCKGPDGDFYGLIEVEVVAAYHSTHLDDGDVHKFSLCERCVLELTLGFKYSSLQGNYLDKSVNSVEGFDIKKYWPEGTSFPGEPEFEQAMKDIREHSAQNSEWSEVTDEDLLNDLFGEDLLDGDFVSMLKPIIKKEDLN